MRIWRRASELVFRNFGLKMLSLAIALAMWWGVAREPVAEMALTVPIEFHGVPRGLEISSEVLPEVQIRIRGPRRVLRQIVQSDVHPVIDMANAQPGEKTYNLVPGQIQLPADVQVVQLIPAQLQVSFDRRATKEVEVRPRVIGTFASGYRIVSTHVQPATLEIAGPAKRVEAIDSAITDPVDATGVIGQAMFTTNAYIADPLVRVVHPVPIHVTVITGKTNSNSETSETTTHEPRKK